MLRSCQSKRLNSLCCICPNKLLETQSYKWNQMIKILDLSLSYSESFGWMSDVHWVLMCVFSRHTPPSPSHLFSLRIYFFKSVNVWKDISAGLKGHRVYGEWLLSLHNISVNFVCSSSELITAPRGGSASPIGKWEPSANQKLSSHVLVLFTHFPSCPHSHALSAAFAFPSVCVLVWSQFLILRVFPEILQLIGCNCVLGTYYI